MTSRSCKEFAFSPEKDQCTSCGRFAVAGPMGLCRHFARNPQCSLDYATELNPCRQQDLFPFIQSTTGRPQTDVRQSNPVLIHTRKGSLNFNELLCSLAGDSVAHLSSRDIPNNDAGRRGRKFSYCISIILVMNVLWATSYLFSRMTKVLPSCLQSTLSPMLLWTARQFFIHLLLTPNPSAMGYFFHYFQSRRRFRLTSCKLSRDFVPQWLHMMR